VGTAKRFAPNWKSYWVTFNIVGLALMGEKQQNGMKKRVLGGDESSLNPVGHSVTKSDHQSLQRPKMDSFVQPRKKLELQNVSRANFVYARNSARGVEANKKFVYPGQRNRRLARKKKSAVSSRYGKGRRTIGIQCNLDVPENHDSNNLPKTRKGSNDTGFLASENDYTFPKLISPRLRGEQFEEFHLDLTKDIFDSSDLFDEEFDLFDEQIFLDSNSHGTTRNAQNRVPPDCVSENVPDLINDKKKRKLRVPVPIILDGYALPDR
jgi:hypothetical protein